MQGRAVLGPTARRAEVARRQPLSAVDLADHSGGAVALDPPAIRDGVEDLQPPAA